ncbi:MAG: hypothetical protein GX146_01085 [Myxococcales bacterium]|jgi:hypothetical protein|nr:hypothetical protein [Myxococcales bacterium]
MKTTAFLAALFQAARRYLVLLVLLLTLGSAVVTTIVRGMGPVPQLPPVGFSVERGRVDLQWHRGNIDAPIHLQISLTPDFTDPLLDQEVSGTTHTYHKELLRDQTYYWRLIQGDYTSPVSSFVISPYHVKL